MITPKNILTEGENERNPERSNKKMRLKDFKIIESLHKDTFSELFVARNKSDQRLYTLKKTNKLLLSQKNQEHKAFTERQILSQLNHPGVSALQASFQTEGFLWLVLDNEESLTLREVSKKSKSKFNR